MTCPQCRYVYCWICKKDLRVDHYKHFKVGERPFGCGLALHSNNFFVILSTLAVRHYTVPVIWWNIYIRTNFVKLFKQLEEEVGAIRDKGLGIIWVAFTFGIMHLLVISFYLCTVVPAVEVFILYSNLFILVRKYLCCCCWIIKLINNHFSSKSLS